MKNLTAFLIVMLLAVTACKKDQPKDNQNIADSSASSDSITAIAKEAWIYGYPIFYNYKAIYASALNKEDRAYVGFNKFKSFATSATPADTLVITINNDTPYSMAALDVSNEPVVLEVPKIENDRYYVMQLVDLYTFNYEYIGTRVTGNNPGKYLLAGPDWKGETPKGIDKVLHSETNLIFIVGRTQLHDPSDVSNLKRIQGQYQLIPLHEYTKQPAPQLKKYNLPLPSWKESDYGSLEFINVLNSLLQYASEDSSEKELRARFTKIGIVPGTSFDSSKYSPETIKAIEKGIAEGKQELEITLNNLKEFGNLFGTRAELKNNYLNRAVAAAAGIYGNTKEEAVYTGASNDKTNQPLSGDKNYILKFSKKELPEAKYFWSITMYNLPKRFLVPNPIKRYSIGNKTKGLKYESNGDLIIYLQSTSPGKDKESNWLPTPKNEKFMFVTRIYGPQPDVINNVWKMPLPEIVK
ncbi:Uncharacterized conserved protein [Flavobacterium resistens]|uniref:DUF1254 domain-containing protein n=1 Tax=Flavobacterium resistens TaxID=443612 RepID=A0A521D928_9FLAO|nr:DUF1254 domain-containing protein [Flavobacterium resistens]MRX70396.1 DUF1254 domain-containing protein [Flavobacterium resistens]SMO68102.1 Uncharacterized conserved protein [Flavobacterium resistens]